MYFPVPQTKMKFLVNFSSMATSGRQINNPLTSTRHLNLMILHLITAHIYMCKHAKLF